MFEKQCSKCKTVVKGETLGNASRALGVHMRFAHGIKGRKDGGYVPVWAQPNHPKYDPERVKSEGVNAPPANIASLELARKAKAEERRRAKLKELSSKVQPLALPRCPECGGEFFQRINGKYNPIKMKQCEPCGIRFYFAKDYKELPAP